MKEFVKGRTADEKFKSINVTLKHFSRRLQKTYIGLVPSAPVFEFIFIPSSDGVVLRRVFPVAGKITKSCVFVANHEGKGPTIFDVLIESSDGGLTRTVSSSFNVKKAPLLFDLDAPVNGGDRWTLSVRDPGKVRGIWIGFLYEVDYRALGKEGFAIEQFENLLEDKEDATNEEG